MLKKIISIGVLSIIGIHSTYATTASLYISPSIAYQSLYQGGGVTYEGVTGKLALGGGIRAWDYVYLGAEAFGSSKPYNVKSGDPDIFKPNIIYGFSILPGVYFDDTILGYVRAGLAYAHFPNLNATPKGYNIGVGLEWGLNCNLSVRGEYDYTRYKSIAGTGAINENELYIGLNYRFHL